MRCSLLASVDYTFIGLTNDFNRIAVHASLLEIVCLEVSGALCESVLICKVMHPVGQVKEVDLCQTAVTAAASLLLQVFGSLLLDHAELKFILQPPLGLCCEKKPKIGLVGINKSTLFPCVFL
jgi:hypothetical protein